MFVKSSSFSTFRRLSSRMGALRRASGLLLAAWGVSVAAPDSLAQTQITLAADWFDRDTQDLFDYFGDLYFSDHDSVFLTRNLGDQQSYYATADLVNMAPDRSFSVFFTVAIGDNIGDGADGVRFFLSPYQQPGFVETQIFGLHLDTYHNSNLGETSHNSISITTSQGRGVSGTDRYADLPFQLDRDDGLNEWNVWADYNGATGQLEVRISADKIRPATPAINAYTPELSELPSQLYAGFYADTGLYASTQELKSLLFNAGYLPLDVANEVYYSPQFGIRPEIVAYNGPTTVEQGGELPINIEDFTISDADTDPSAFWLEIGFGEFFGADGNILYIDGGHVGPIQVEVAVWDGFTTSRPFVIDIEVTGDNLPPSFDPQPITVEAGHPFLFPMEALGLSDPDDTVANYYVETYGSNAYEYNWDTGEITILPFAPQSFIMNVQVWYHTNAFYREVAVPVFVDQHPPTISRTSFRVAPSGALTLTPELLQVQDADTPLSSYSVQVTPDQQTYTVDQQGAILPLVSSGVIYVNILLINSETGAQHPFQVRVGVSDLPNVAPVIEGVSHAFTINEDESLELGLGDFIIDDEHLPELHTLNVAVGANYTVENGILRPSLNFYGELQVSVTVSDGEFESQPFNFAVSVLPVDDLPQFEPPTTWIYYNRDREFTFADLGFSDADNETTDYQIEVLPHTSYNYLGDNRVRALPESALTVFVRVRVTKLDSTFTQDVNLLANVVYGPVLGTDLITVYPGGNSISVSGDLMLSDPDTEYWNYTLHILPGEGYEGGNWGFVNVPADVDSFDLYFRLINDLTGESFDFSVTANVVIPELNLDLGNTTAFHRVRGAMSQIFWQASYTGVPVSSLEITFEDETYRYGQDELTFLPGPEQMLSQGYFAAEEGTLYIDFWEVPGDEVTIPEALSVVRYVNTSPFADLTERVISITPISETGYAGEPVYVTLSFSQPEYHALSFGPQTVAVSPDLSVMPDNGITTQLWLRPHEPEFAGEIFSIPTWGGVMLSMAIREDAALAMAINYEMLTVTPAQAVTPGKWNHVSLVLDPQGEARFYINGNLFHSAAFDYELLMAEGGGGQNPLPQLQQEMPGYGSTFGGLDQMGFQGDLDEFYLWRTALSGERIQSTFRQPLSSQNHELDLLEAYFHFDEGDTLFAYGFAPVSEYAAMLGLGTTGWEYPSIEIAPSWFMVAPAVDGDPFRSAMFDEDNLPRRYRPITFTEGLSPIPQGISQWAVSTDGNLGLATITTLPGGEGRLDYAPIGNANGFESLVVGLSAPGSATQLVEVGISINPRNDPPVNLTAPHFEYFKDGELHYLRAFDGEWADNIDLTPGEITYSYRWEVADNAIGSNAVTIDSPLGIISVSERDLSRYFQLTVIATNTGEGTPLTRTVEFSTGFSRIEDTYPSYSSWILGMLPNATEAERNPAYDFDGDALPNEHEYFMGLDPQSPDNGVFNISPEVVNGQAVYAFYFTVVNRFPVNIAVEHSTDMAAWTELDTVEVVQEAGDSLLYRATVPFDKSAHFFRLYFQPLAPQ